MDDSTKVTPLRFRDTPEPEDTEAAPDTAPYRKDFFSRYLDITDGTEVPTFFRRWSMIVAVGAWLGRTVYFQHGDMKVYPNLYAMLLGAPGTRKSTAIKGAKKLLAKTGYSSFSAEKITKEKFLLDLAGAEAEEGIDGFLDLDLGASDYAECFIAADEFNDFFGNNILDFVSLLGVLWDYDGVYKSKVKNGVSVEIPDPTISILGGNTQTTFANTFPPEVIGQGFFSRIIAVYSEPTSKKIAFPKAPDPEEVDGLVEHLNAIKLECNGALELTPEARDLIEKIYLTWEGIEDDRFSHYGNRRMTHLLKLITIHTVVRLSMVIELQDVQYANTVLHHTEHYMPKAFGEFGRAKNAGVAHKVLSLLDASDAAIGMDKLWERVSSDLNDMGELGDILRGLAAASKIQVTEHGFLSNKKPLVEHHTDTVEYNWLSNAEIYGE